jgi:RHS repeat-associated protein
MTGLDFQGRYYGSALGRWTSPDEVFADQHPADPQSWNLYGYVRNNPLASIDDNGRSTLAISMGGQQNINVKQEMQAAATGVRNTVVGALKNAANNAISIGNAGSSLIKAVSGGTVDLGQAAPVATSTAESQAADAAVTVVGLGMGVKGGTASNEAPGFAVSPGGDVIPVPEGASGPNPVINNSGKTTGFSYNGGQGGNGLDPRVTDVRVMDPTPPRGSSPGYPDGYVTYQNKAGQGVNPQTGKTVPNSDPSRHIPLSSCGGGGSCP